MPLIKQYNTKVTPIKKESIKTNSWIGGLNTLISNTQIKQTELSVAKDIQLVEDGKIQCPRTGQSYFGLSNGSRVTGLFPFYKSNGTNQLLRISGTKLQKYNEISDSWDDVSGFSYTTTLNTEAVTAYDNVYICNGTDPLTKYDGTSIISYTAISAPSAPTVTRTGTTGSYTFSYKITAVTAVGETNPSPAGTSNLNQAGLDSSNYMSISWSGVTNAIGYNVYGRKDGDWKFIAYLEGNSSTTYVDKGTVTPSTVFTPPEGNTTGGVKGKYIELYKDTIFITGDSTNPSRLYYSGGGDKVDDFTISNGGGFIDVSKNDGQIITGIKKFKNVLLIFKEDSIYQFSFTTDGLPQVTQVSPNIGCIAPRTIIIVENDVHFLGRRGWFTVGNVENFSFDVLRTNEASPRVRSIIQSIASSYIENTTAVYATKNNTNIVVISYTPTGSTTNSKALVFDRERLAWFEWTNISANCFCNYIDSTGKVRVLYGDDSSGYVKELLNGNDDFGTPIIGKFRTSGKDFDKAGYKTLNQLDWEFRTPTGVVSVGIVVDGVNIEKTIPIATVNPSINFGHYSFMDFLFGSSQGTGTTSQDENVLRTYKGLSIEGRNFLLEYQNSSSGSFILLSEQLVCKPKSLNYRKDGDIITSS